MVSKEQLIQDFAAFADPATMPVVNEGHETIDVRLTRDADEVRFTVNRQSGAVALRAPSQRQMPSIAALLADQIFANIRSLYSMQRQINITFKEDDFLDPEGQLTFSDDRVTDLTVSALDNALTPSELPNDRTRVILLDGQAGVGKTSLIRRLLVRRAHGTTFPPIVHVVSRGNRLFGLNQLLAAALDTLRAKFTFDQVPPLLRHRLIHIAIDGFDELVDSEGYADSWTALADFLSEVGLGAGLILAGRDTFFDQQAFRERLGAASARIELVGARLTSVRASNARQYLEKKGWNTQELSSGPGPDMLREGSYALRPYFLSVLAAAEHKKWSVLLAGITLRSFLMERFLRREANLVKDNTTLDLELAVARLREVFSEIALEMAASETSAVDTSFIELVVETVFVNDLPGASIGRLKYKSGSLGFLESDSQSGYRRFPHTEVSHYFLSIGIIQSIGEPTVRRVLRRASLEVDFLSIFSEVFGGLRNSEAAIFLSKLHDIVATESFSQDRFQANVGALWLATLSWSFQSVEQQIADRQLLDAAIFGVASPARLHRVLINRLDVRGTDLQRVTFIDCVVSTLIADDDTLFGLDLPSVLHLQLVSVRGVTDLRGPELAAWLSKHRAEEERRTSESEALLWRVILVLRRRYSIRDSLDDTAGRLLREPLWPKIERVLQSAGRVVRDESLPVSGPNDSFFRIRDLAGLMENNDPATRAIWREVASIT